MKFCSGRKTSSLRFKVRALRLIRVAYGSRQTNYCSEKHGETKASTAQISSNEGKRRVRVLYQLRNGVFGGPDVSE